MPLLSSLAHLALALTAVMVPAPVVALTFDDGPGPHTPQILDALQDADAVGTFFVVGDQIPGREHLVADLVDGGMSVQWHSASHPDLTAVPESQLIAEMVLPDALSDVGAHPSCLRPPYGATDRTVTEAAGAAGLDVVLWDVDPRDWAAENPQQIVDAVMTQVYDRSVVLLHSRELTADALPRLLQELDHAGFRTVLVCA